CADHQFRDRGALSHTLSRSVPACPQPRSVWRRAASWFVSNQATARTGGQISDGDPEIKHRVPAVLRVLEVYRPEVPDAPWCPRSAVLDRSATAARRRGAA